MILFLGVNIEKHVEIYRVYLRLKTIIVNEKSKNV